MWIHGFGCDADRWLFTQQPLSAVASVYALDLPGHGQSSKILRDAGVPALADVVIAFMDAVDVTQARLIGHSLGGAIALQAAVAHPQRVSALNLIAPAGLGPEINSEYIKGFITTDNRKEMKVLLQQLVADPELVNRGLVNDMLQFKRIDGVPAALTAIAAGFVAGDGQCFNLRDKLSDLSQPVHVIWGAEDKIIPASQADNLPSSVKVDVLPNAGHLVQLEAAGQVNSLLGA
jgi:pyruvate dehydrogenase E2 component (dihydrolipoamide acetyltransferase)